MTKPTKAPDGHYRDDPTSPLHVQANWIWAPLKKAWLVAKPEELIRQEFIYRLHTEWGYLLEQMRQEVKTQKGRKSSKADIVIAASAEDASQNRNWRIAVEVKAEAVPINPDDYEQGESYARAVGAEFLVMYNQKTQAFFQLIPGAPGRRAEITQLARVDELSDEKRLAEIRHATKHFSREEFQRLLFECHSILRDNHKMDPGAAFDEISKILFIKMAYERLGRSAVFSTDRLEAIRAASLSTDDTDVLSHMFEEAKRYYRADDLFSESDNLKVSMATFRRIVEKLQVFNLSDTSDDVKGIAFERFLGQTFRGELGQYFTPRPLVEFMVQVLDPKEGELICDPASGTGGFLIAVFEHLRKQVAEDVQRSKEKEVRALRRKAAKEESDEAQLEDAINEVQGKWNRELDPNEPSSRLHTIAQESLYGTDAESRASRTSKMNMIMHGDGHGGIHFHDGLLDVNGIFEGRFDVVLTNPPFGSTVGKDQLVGTTPQTKVTADAAEVRNYRDKYGEEWEAAHLRLTVAAAEKKPILELFDIGRDPIGGDPGSSKIRRSRATEHLFIERCLDLLKPGGRVGIVLPDGILNNPSLSWLRSYVEGRGRLLAVVSIPQEVFASSKASVKTSIVFLQRLTRAQEEEWLRAFETARVEVDTATATEQAEIERLRRRSASYDHHELEPLVVRIAQLEESGDDEKALRQAKTELRTLITPADRDVSRTLAKDALAREKALRSHVEESIRERVRELTSYPVFMAEATAAGITSTGATGPDVANDLPRIAEEYRRFVEDPHTFAIEVETLLETSASGSDL